MTRAEIERELQQAACDWRVPLERLRCNGDRFQGTPDALVTAARAVFIRKMFAGGVETGHVAWALNMTTSSVRAWYRRLREAEATWFGLK